MAVRAHQVKPDDLVVAYLANGTGVRPAKHVPEPFPAAPHTFADCPCNGCDECDDMDAWTLADHARVADVGWRFVCLAPSEDDEPCVVVLRNQPVAVVPADVAARARAAAAPPVRTYGVVWTDDFEAASPQEAARLAYEQLKAFAADGPPVLEVDDGHGVRTIIDLNVEAGVRMATDPNAGMEANG
ncbi:hypothetical protein ACO0M4_12510 [Streptomyces sp. RGM 3693]|uniref:hypothetical protein n=1 Tax=Streptomyces sp. RGM 3693 TaxID=3413284 RepID=UPI003D2AC9C0